MTTQKEIDNTFIATLESIIGVCEKTTSGNVSHNVATCLLLLLIIDKPYKTSAKGFRLYLRKCRRVSKLLLAQILCGIFKFIDKYIKSLDNK